MTCFYCVVKIFVMSPYIVLLTLALYLFLLFALSRFSSRRADNAGFFIGNRRTSWYMATLAMIGAAMSGVTYISVPGSVASDNFSYMQMVVGFTIGQFIVAFLLVPLFYRLRIVSLYEYLDSRFGVTTHRWGAWCFLLAKIIGSSLKLYVVCVVMQMLVFDHLNIHFMWHLLLTMSIVYLYTYRGGVSSLILTDSLQSLCLVGSVVVVIWFICREIGLSFNDTFEVVSNSQYSKMWFFDDPSSKYYFWKMVSGGALCLVAMTGLDQDMMQRNLSCRSKRDSQINIVLTALCQIVVIALFLALGVLLYEYIDFKSLPMPVRGDDAFALVAVNGGLPLVVGVVFVVGLISSTYSAAGSALTSLTTSFTIDILDAQRRYEESALKRLRKRIHFVMAVVMTLMIILFEYFADQSAINLVFKLAGYTYGPILGMFVYGMISKRKIKENLLCWVVLISPLMSYLLQWFVAKNYDYYIGFELLGYNALFCIFGLQLISKPNEETV